MTMSAMPAPNDFDAAKLIGETLRPFDKAKQEQILRWVAESLGLVNPASKLAETHGDRKPAPDTLVAAVAAAPDLGKAIDIKSFVAAKQPKSDNQFAAVVAYFYRFVADTAGRKEAITAEDLQQATRLAGRDRFKTPSVTLNNAINQGYLDRGGRGEYRINTVGENLVAMALPSENGNDTSRRPRPNKPARKAPGARK